MSLGSGQFALPFQEKAPAVKLVNVINQSGEWLQPTDQNKTLNLERKTMTGNYKEPSTNKPPTASYQTIGMTGFIKYLKGG